MGVETVRREQDVRAVRCDWVALDEAGGVVETCSAVTTEFLPDVDAPQGGPVLMNARWLQLRTGGISQWYFCSHDHLADWVVGAGEKILVPQVENLATRPNR